MKKIIIFVIIIIAIAITTAFFYEVKVQSPSAPTEAEVVHYPPLTEKPKTISAKNRPTILMYHLISTPPPDAPYKYLYVSPEKFEQDMKYIVDNGYTAISPEEIFDSSNVQKPIIITFDDGYEDNYTNGYPILQKYNLKASIFVITNKIDTDGMLKSEQIKEMADSNLIHIYPHTANHPDLTGLSTEEIENEFSESKERIYQITGKEVDVISYPEGLANDDVFQIAEKYFNVGFMVGGSHASQTNVIRLQRQTVTEGIPMEKLLNR